MWVISKETLHPVLPSVVWFVCNPVRNVELNNHFDRNPKAESLQANFR